MKLCKIKYCKNKPVKNGYECSKHVMRRWRKNNPIKAAYNNLKENAKRRKKPFDLTFEQFKKFAIESQYIAGKGKSKTSFHIDRIRENEGYYIDNLQVLTNSENVKKYFRYSKDMNGKLIGCTTEKAPEHEQSDCPF